MEYKKGYLKVEDGGKGMFSGERILYAKTYSGKTIDGFFDNGNIINGRLRVTVLAEEGDAVTILPPQYFFKAGSFILVKKSDLEYK
jgi:hypothetical protein